MKPYRTSFMKVSALMMLVLSLSFFSSQSSKAQCRFSISTADSVWVFSATAGSTQSRTLFITNTTNSSIDITAGIVSGTQFSLNQDSFSIAAGDSATLVITFDPSSNTTAKLITDMLRIATSNSDCRHYLTLSGTVTGGTTGGGGDKVVLLDPSSVVLGPIPAGADTCREVYLVNHTGTSVTISSITIVGSDAFTVSPPYIGATIDSGASYGVLVCFKGSATTSRIADSISVIVAYNGVNHTVAGTLIGYTTTPPPPVVLVADPHEFTFGTVDFGTSLCKDVVVSNKSNSAVVLRYWSTCDSNANHSDFSLTPASGVPDTLAIGASMTFTICYKPHEANIQASCNFAASYFKTDGSFDGVLLVYFNGNSGTDSTITHTPVCLRSEQGANNSDAIIAGTTASHSLTLINNTNFAINVKSATVEATNTSVFTITSTFPITVPANSSTTTLDYTFAPPTAGTAYSYEGGVVMQLSGDSIQCTETKGVLIGYVVHNDNTNDSIVRPIFSNDHILAIEGSDKHPTSTTFYFTNNFSTDATVKGISVDSTQYFSIASYSPSPTPFVLHAGENMNVVVSFIATDHLVHHAHLIIDADHALQTPTFNLEGLSSAAASVAASLPAGVEINVSPNPATDHITVTMTQVSSADIQMYDVLGKPVASIKATANCELPTANYVAGSYIIRVSGTSTSGEQFVSSKRIVLTK